MVSLPVSHMGLEAGISFSSGAGIHQNGALTQVQLAGWEGAVCIFNTRSDTLKENSCQYVTRMSQSQMLDGFGVFCPFSLVQAESSSEEEHLRVLFWGAVLISKQNELSFSSRPTYCHGILMSSFPSSHFQPSLVCLKTLAIVFKSLILLLSACCLCCQECKAGGVKGVLYLGMTCSSGKFLTRSPVKEHGGQDFKRNELLSPFLCL